jgi:hypothetical protein
MLNLFLFILVVFLATPMISIRRIVKEMSSGQYRAVSCVEIADKMKSLVPHQNFLELNKFSFDDSLRCQGIEIGGWTQSKTSVIDRQYIFMSSPKPNGLKIFELITLFGNDITLTTTTTASAFLFPRPPGSFLQSMITSDVEDLWKYHLEGENFLLNEHGVKPSQITTTNIEHLITQEIQTQGKYISKTPFFWLKAPYWFYIHRSRMRGVSIRKQFSR